MTTTDHAPLLPLPGDLESAGLIDMAKVLRVSAVAVALEDALSEGALDEMALRRLDREVSALLVEAGSALPDDLLVELGRLAAPLQHRDRTPDEVRITLGLLTGWLTGLMRSVRMA